MTTRAVPNSDPRKDLRCITSPDGRILSDRRSQTSSNYSKITLPSQQQKPSSLPKPRRFIVKGPKPK